MTKPWMPGCHAVVLAAGAGRRFGGGKLTAPCHGRPLVTWAVETALAAPVERVTVVLGCAADDVAEALVPWRCDRLTTLRSERWHEGLGRSLADGVASLPPDWVAILVILGDMPALEHDRAAPLLRAVHDGAPAALPRLGDRDGHPVAVSRALWTRIGPPQSDAGLGRAIRAEPGVVRLTTTAPGALLDIDKRADLERLGAILPSLVRRHAAPPTAQKASSR